MIVKKLMLALALTTTAAFASPSYLITHNRTNVESNAYIDGTMASPKPTPANSDNRIHWALVRLICSGHVKDGKCSALIKMATNTANPVELGMVTMDMSTGDITPKSINKNGYTLTVNGPGESTVTKN